MASYTQFSMMKTLLHLSIGLVGSILAGSGQFMHARTLKSNKDKCKKGGFKGCDEKYKSPYGTVGMITLYGGCAFVLIGFIIIAILNSGLFRQRGQQGYGGGRMMQQQWGDNRY